MTSALDPEKQGRGGIKVGLHPLLMQKPGTKLNLGRGFSTSKANQKKLNHEFRIALNATQKPKLKIEKPPADFSNPYKNPYFDPKLVTSASSAPREKYNKSIKFAPQGKYIEEANQIRANEHLEKLKEKIAATVRKTGMEADMDLVADDSLRSDPPPGTEWWDLPLLKDGNYESLLDHGILNTEGEPVITNLIHHPIPIQPPNSDNVPPMIVMLTKKVFFMSNVRNGKKCDDRKD
jgi:U4/U6 small nuclear ribonucleoprotein PRP3